MIHGVIHGPEGVGEGRAELRRSIRRARVRVVSTDADIAGWLDAIPLGPAWGALPASIDSVDPGSVRDRLSLYKALIEHSGAPPLLGARGERHIFWGYAAQLHWQWQSGRLGAGPGDDRIDPDSWWGAMNASLSLLPARAGAEAGLLSGVAVGREGDPLTEHADVFAGAEEHWVHFFREVARVGDEAGWETARVSGWRAHVATVEAGVRVFAPRFRRLSGPEGEFGRGWTRMVDFFGSAALRTDLEAIARYRSSLPPRPLREGERPGEASDFDADTNDATRRIAALAALPAWRFAIRRAMWNRSMRDPVLREASLDILFGDKGRDPAIQRRFRRALLPGPVAA